ncbi:MAG: Ribosome maturation factor RimP [Clostridium sp.]|jgi:ribosome maturation factor RimP
MPGKVGKGGVAAAVRKLALPYAQQLGLSLWDVRYEKEGGAWYLRIFIDKPGGVGIDDCEAMSRAIDGPLDELDPIKEPYCLEVSSPGLNRELRREEHFTAFLGSRVAVRLIRPLPDGTRDLIGKLAGYADGRVKLTADSEETVEVPVRDTAWVRLQEDELEEYEE